MNVFEIEGIIEKFSNFLWGWPIVFYIILSGIICSIAFSFIQIKGFFKSWKFLFQNDENKSTTKDSISPFQAFINALSSSLGNGGLAGMATVLVDGGPGTAFWVFMLGLISMILRFSEVYAGLTIKGKDKAFNGPLAYIQRLPLGKFFAYLYSTIMIIYILSAGIAMQTNSMGLSIQKTISISPLSIGILFGLIMLYIILGGSKRIMKLSQYIIPVKVLLFFFGIIALLIYHFDKIGAAFRLVMDNAFTMESATKGAAIYTMQRAITVGFARALNATEAGVGTASIFFGATEAKNPFKTSVMSMVSAFISTNLVCAVLIFVIILTGVPTDGLTSTKLVISAFETLFGKFAGPGITFLSLSFGLGVMVGYTFLGMRIWEFLFGKKSIWFYYASLPVIAFLGTTAPVSLIWKSMDLLAGLLIVINIAGVLWSIPKMRANFRKDIKENL